MACLIKGKNKQKEVVRKEAFETPQLNYKAVFFGMYSEFNDKGKVIIDILYDYAMKNKLKREDFEKVGVKNTFSDMPKYSVPYNATTYKDFIDKFSDEPEKLKKLLEVLSDINGLYLAVREKYSYEQLLTIVFPNFKKEKYIANMVKNKYSDEEIKYCLDNEIFFDSYHESFDYKDINDSLEKIGITNQNKKMKYYLLTNRTLKYLISAFNADEIERITSTISTITIKGDFKKINDLILFLVRNKGFSFLELDLFLPILATFSNVQINKLRLFLTVSTKEELFKKMFDI